jgi:hypothetical protein
VPAAASTPPLTASTGRHILAISLGDELADLEQVEAERFDLSQAP